MLALHGSDRFLKDLTCSDSSNPDWTCDKDTEECGAYPTCDVVCEIDDCNGNGKCKNGKCDCYERFDGDSCDKCAKGYYKYKDGCKYKDVDVEYKVEFYVGMDLTTAEVEDCAEIIDDLQCKVDGLTEELPDEARVKVSGSRKSRRLKSHSRSELLIQIDVEVDDCNQTSVVNAVIGAFQDVSAPTGATFRSGQSRGSRD